MAELTREEMVERIGEEAMAKIEYAIAHPEESRVRRRERPKKLD